ncbi:unnamed protein product [Candidula unifasciata]|uniref:adenosine deaminase n=1 Tax=Candidula unifasciata TaxID=100452 RepID=A0A8S3ZNG6_9EUPU|nr:unnamed protein product [Candidula unifasciata]
MISVFLLAALTEGAPVTSEYLQTRTQLIATDSSRRIGGKLPLSADEQIVNEVFMKEKRRLIDESRRNQTPYIPAQSFYISRPLIENSTLLKLIRRMPKGAALHLHDTSVTSLDWLIKNATYRDNIYMCVAADGLINFQAFLNPPNNSDCVWRSVRDERARAEDIAAFDLNLKRNLSLLVSDPLTTYIDNADVWRRFDRYFSQVQNLIYYTPIFRDYFWRMLEEVRNENVQYVEIRSGLDGVFDLDGTVYDAEFAVQIYKNTSAEFVRQYPDFSGARIIMSGFKDSPFDTILNEIKTAITLNQKYPDVFVGYDLTGNEVLINPLVFYIDALLYPGRQNPPVKLPYFFHAGETNWQGTETDNNLVDALLLNSTRIGHAFALPKRPQLLQLVRERNIPLEVNPLSNQILRLVSDLRNHPMASLMADDFPIVIGCDNMVVWEALPQSHDFYVAFMDMSGRDADLTFLKQLAVNTIKYSALGASQKKAAMNLWQTKWNRFIDEVVREQKAGRSYKG